MENTDFFGEIIRAAIEETSKSKPRRNYSGDDATMENRKILAKNNIFVCGIKYGGQDRARREIKDQWGTK